MLEPTGKQGSYTYDPSVPAGTGGGGGSGSGGGLVIHQDEDTGTLDATWKQIDDALASGILAFIVGEENGGHQMRVMGASEVSADQYYVYDMNMAGYVTDSPDGYPAPDNDPGPMV